MYLIPNCIMYGKDGKNSVLPVFPQAKWARYRRYRILPENTFFHSFLKTPDTMHIEQVKTGKHRFLNPLLIADPDRHMIDRYLDRCELLPFMTVENSKASASSRPKAKRFAN